MRRVIQTMFPITGTNYRIELISTEPVTLELTTENDVMSQQLEVRDEARACELISRVPRRDGRLVFSAMGLLESKLSVDDILHAIEDPRSQQILSTFDRALLDLIDLDRVVPPMFSNAELEDRIAAGEDAHAVYADWLSRSARRADLDRAGARDRR